MAVTLLTAAAAQVAGVTTPAAVAGITPTVTTTTLALNPKQRVFVYQSHSCETGSAATPSNWTASYKDVVVGTGTASAAAGRRFISCYWRDWDGSWTMPSFDLASATQNSHAIATLTLLCDPQETFDTPTFSGDGEYFGTAGTAFSAATPAAFNAVTKAFLMLHAVTNDNVTATTGALTGSGFTSGTVTERADSGTATGNDVAIKLHTCVPTTGANVALTHTMTLSAASQGGWAAVQQTATYTGSAPSGSPFLYDYFRDADGVAVTAHTSDSGHTWATQTGYSAGGLHQANRLYSASDSGNRASATPPSADYEVTAAVRFISHVNASAVGVIGRASNSALTLYTAFLYSSGGNYYLYVSRFLTSGYAELGNTILSPQPSANSDHTISLRMVGNQISAYYDGVLQSGPYTNSDVTAAGFAGLRQSTQAATTGVHLEYVKAVDLGAVNYTTDPNDAVGITDSVTKDAGRDATDAVGITDSATKDAGRTATDAVGVADALSHTQDFVRSATDNVGVTDSYSQAQDWARSDTDLVGITDSAVFSLAFVAGATDTVGITDAGSVQQDWVRTSTDPVGVTDSVTLGLGRSVTDSVGISDSATVQQDWVRAQTDPVGISDSSVLDLGRLATDLISITDSVSQTQDWVRAEADDVGVSDSGTFDLAGAGNVTETDQIGITDSVAAVADSVRSQVDPVGVTDSALFYTAFPVDSDDWVLATDLFAITAAYERSWTDPVGVADSASFIIEAAGEVTDTDLVGIADSSSVTADYVQEFTDPVGATDSVDLLTEFARGFSDPVGVVDAAQFQLAGGDTVVDTADPVGVSDTAWFAIKIPPGPDNSWVPRAESVIHTVTEAGGSRHTGPTEFNSYALKSEYNTYAARAETNHLEVIG